MRTTIAMAMLLLASPLAAQEIAAQETRTAPIDQPAPAATLA